MSIPYYNSWSSTFFGLTSGLVPWHLSFSLYVLIFLVIPLDIHCCLDRHTFLRYISYSTNIHVRIIWNTRFVLWFSILKYVNHSRSLVPNCIYSTLFCSYFTMILSTEFHQTPLTDSRFPSCRRTGNFFGHRVTMPSLTERPYQASQHWLELIARMT
jgi:hypothetical protein